MVAKNEKVYTENLVCPYCLEDITQIIREFIMLPMLVIKHTQKFIDIKDAPICPKCGKQFKGVIRLRKSYDTGEWPWPEKLKEQKKDG